MKSPHNAGFLLSLTRLPLRNLHQLMQLEYPRTAAPIQVVTLLVAAPPQSGTAAPQPDPPPMYRPPSCSVLIVVSRKMGRIENRTICSLITDGGSAGFLDGGDRVDEIAAATFVRSLINLASMWCPGLWRGGMASPVRQNRAKSVARRHLEVARTIGLPTRAFARFLC